MKTLLRYFLLEIQDAKAAAGSESKLLDSEMSAEDGDSGKKSSPGKTASRSNHQRIQAIEIFNSLVKAGQKNHKLLQGLAEHLELITSVVLSMLKSADTWQ